MIVNRQPYVQNKIYNTPTNNSVKFNGSGQIIREGNELIIKAGSDVIPDIIQHAGSIKVEGGEFEKIIGGSTVWIKGNSNVPEVEGKVVYVVGSAHVGKATAKSSIITNNKAKIDEANAYYINTRCNSQVEKANVKNAYIDEFSKINKLHLTEPDSNYLINDYNVYIDHRASVGTLDAFSKTVIKGSKRRIKNLIIQDKTNIPLLKRILNAFQPKIDAN